MADARSTLSWATFFPFTSTALSSLPSSQRPARYTRQDDIPEAAEADDTVPDYHAINSAPPQIRVPKKLATSLKVEGKVWFANERSEHIHSYFIIHPIHVLQPGYLGSTLRFFLQHWLLLCLMHRRSPSRAILPILMLRSALAFW